MFFGKTSFSLFAVSKFIISFQGTFLRCQAQLFSFLFFAQARANRNVMIKWVCSSRMDFLFFFSYPFFSLFSFFLVGSCSWPTQISLIWYPDELLSACQAYFSYHKIASFPWNFFHYLQLSAPPLAIDLFCRGFSKWYTSPGLFTLLISLKLLQIEL